MPEKEVCSPVSRRGSAVGGGQPLSPGARSNPSRADVARDPASKQPQDAMVRSSSKPAGAQTTIVGPGT
jgi:hypothetical protein